MDEIIDSEKDYEILKEAWRIRRLAELEKFFFLIEQSYCAGMSIVEIKSAIGARTVKFVLKTLAIRKVISLPPLSRKRYQLPEHINSAFEKLAFPFEHWCAVNEFDPKVATAALKLDPRDRMAASWSEIHRTAQLDFPWIYSKQYGAEPPEYAPAYSREHERLSFLIMWVGNKKLYCGSILEIPTFEVYGKSKDEVFAKLKEFDNIDRQTLRLEKALKQFESSREPS